MPHCVALGCFNHSYNKPVAFYKLPTGRGSEQQRKAWCEALGRYCLPTICYLCEEHFHDGCFYEVRTYSDRETGNNVPDYEDDVFLDDEYCVRMMALPTCEVKKVVRTLRADAVPTIFPYKERTGRIMKSVNKRSNKSQNVEEIAVRRSSVSSHVSTGKISNLSHDEEEEDETESVVTNTKEGSYVKKLKEKLDENDDMRDPDSKWNARKTDAINIEEIELLLKEDFKLSNMRHQPRRQSTSNKLYDNEDVEDSANTGKRTQIVEGGTLKRLKEKLNRAGTFKPGREFSYSFDHGMIGVNVAAETDIKSNFSAQEHSQKEADPTNNKHIGAEKNRNSNWSSSMVFPDTMRSLCDIQCPSIRAPTMMDRPVEESTKSPPTHENIHAESTQNSNKIVSKVENSGNVNPSTHENLQKETEDNGDPYSSTQEHPRTESTKNPPSFPKILNRTGIEIAQKSLQKERSDGGGDHKKNKCVSDMVLDWVRQMTTDYPVEISNFSSSWNDGLAFCALIHRFHPDEFNFDELQPENRHYNFELAFNTAQRLKDIPILLDTDYMTQTDNPEPKSVQTYLQWVWSVYGAISGYDPYCKKFKKVPGCDNGCVV